MAMLAEPRKRKRYNLVPRGKALYEDDQRFGTKMLEKMGWTKGKGLGSQENGNLDFVRVRYKNDAMGLGFEERDDQWTQHQQHFNGLLQSLNGNGDSNDNSKTINKNDDDTGEVSATVGFGFRTVESKKSLMKDKFSGESLEEKSKKSKVRVHYKKFTKGKDLAQYSEKDLANIFGKKGSTEDSSNIYNQFPVIGFNDNTDSNEFNAKKEEDRVNGVQTISSNVSVTDYFKEKMALLKEKGLFRQFRTKENNCDTENGCEVENKKTSTGRNSPVKDVDDKSDKPEIETTPRTCEPVEPVTNKKRKKNKMKDQEKELESAIVIDLEEDEGEEDKACLNIRTTNPENTIQGNSSPIKDVEVCTANNLMQLEIPQDKSNKAEMETTPATYDSVEFTNKKKKKRKNKMKDQEKAQESAIAIDLEEEDNACLNPKISKPNNSTQVKNSPVKDVELCAANNPIPEYKSKKAKIETTPATCPDPVEVTNRNKNKMNQEKEQESAILIESDDEEADKASFKLKTTKPESSTQDTETGAEKNQTTLNSINNSNDTYCISTFCAEKFRNTNLDSFKGSNLVEITGYGLHKNVRLEIIKTKTDNDKIAQLWNCALDKYKDAAPKKTYHSYVKQVITARKNKQKVPRFTVKNWKRKQAFQRL